MTLLQLSLLTLIVNMCESEFIPVLHTFNPISAPVLPTCPLAPHQPMPLPLQPISENTTAPKKPTEKLQFILPFLDMEIQCERNLHVMQEDHKQQIYILHGNELHQLFVNRQETRLSLLAVLKGSVRHVEPLAAKISYWRGSFLLVVALDEYLEVYQLAADVLMQRAENVKNPVRAHEPAPSFEAIQQLSLTGRFHKLFLFTPNKERLMIVAAVNFTKLYGKFRIFEWFTTYFDPIKELTVPPMHMVNVIGSQTKYLITGRTIQHQLKTILTIYEVSPSSLDLSVKQTLTVDSRVVHTFTYRNRNMVVACSSKQQKCSSFRQMPDGHFTVYRYRTPNEFAFDLMAASTRFVSATRNNQVMVFTNHRLDCYGSFVSDQMDVTNLMAYQNAYNEAYVLLVYKRPFKTLVRIVELEINGKDLNMVNHSEPEDILASTRHQHLFESAVVQLRSALLRRKMDMDVLRRVSRILKPNQKNVEVGERVVLHDGNVGVAKVMAESLRSPMQIIQKLEKLRQTYLPQRSRRSDNQESSNETIKINNRLKVHRLRVANLIYQGDVMEGFSLNSTTAKQNLLTVKPKCKTHSLSASELTLPQYKRRQVMPDAIPDLTRAGGVRHLKVDSINGVPWNAFYDSLFLKSRDKLIEGRLVLESRVEIKNLTTKILNGLMVSNLFNLKHPQVVLSDLVVSQFSAPSLKAETVNGLIFEEDIVFSDNDSFIETPVIFQHLNISGDLFVANSTTIERQANNSEENPLTQFYTNKIIINGSLIVNNLNRLNNETKIVSGDQEFDENLIKEKYLLRTEVQNFSFPVDFEEVKITAPHLDTNYLNDYKTEQHLAVNKANTDEPLLAIFTNAYVQGDFTSRDYKSKLAEIQENIIRPGDRVNVTGIKIFEAPLQVNDVETSTLNQLSVKDLVFKTLLSENSSIEFNDSKVFAAIKVKNFSLIAKELQASFLNNLPLESLLSNDYYMDRLHVPHAVQATNLVFHKINGMPFDEFFSELDVNEEHLVLHKNLVVEGSVEFAEALELQYINNVAWSGYVDNLVRLNENASIEGVVSFESDLTITKAFEAAEVNSFDLETIFKNVLKKSKPQLITGLYYFDNLNASSLNVSKINDVNTSEFLDVTRDVSEIESDVVVETLHIGGNFQGNLNCFENLLSLPQKVKQLSTKPWKNVHVLNNASWPTDVKHNDQHELLKYFYKSAVKANQDQVITGNVQIFKPLIKKMQTRLQFPPNVDFNFIQQDALLKNAAVPQHIKGKKVFLKPLYMASLNATNYLNARLLNEINISNFNKSLYRITSRKPLQGPLMFRQHLTVAHLKTHGLINGINSSLIYQLNPNSTLPPLKLQELYIENDVFVRSINGMNMEYFLDNRLTLKGPALEHFGVLTFENLIIEKEALIKAVNDIPIDSMIFKHSPYLQTITGHKTVQNYLEVVGPAQVMRINNEDITELHRNCLKKDENYQFVSLEIERATFEKDLQVKSNSTLSIQQRSSVERALDSDNNNREGFLQFLKEFRENLSHSNREILYLDYDLNASIKWLNHANITANHTISYELSRRSCCEKEYLQVSIQYPNNIYLKTLTSNFFIDTASKISVKAKNYCRLQKHKVKSKITITGQNLLSVFGLKRYVEAIHVFYDKPDHYFVILHALDLPSLELNEIRVFKISTRNNTVEEWQGITRNVGEQVKLFNFSHLHVLLTNGLSEHQPALMIFHFDYTSRLFTLQQIIPGNYDIMEMLELPNSAGTKQLIATCSQCQRIFIYEFNASSEGGKYEIFQIITLKSHIVDKLVMFHLRNERYMVIISQQGHASFYNLYKYAYIQGWLHLATGYFPNLQMSVPLTQSGTRENSVVVSHNTHGIPLILVCNNVGDCYLVKAIA